jgi:hypothetical protein
MKRHIDRSIKDDPKLQQFLQYIDRKTQSVKARYKPVAIRAYYLDLDLFLFRDFDLNIFLSLGPDFFPDLGIDFHQDFVLHYDLARTIDRVIDRDNVLALDLALDLELALDLTLAHAIPLSLSFSQSILVRYLAHCLAHAIALSQGNKLKYQVKQLSDRLPDNSSDNEEDFKLWWSTNGKQWTEDLRQIIITYRDIGHDWQFTDEQKQLLQQYYDANLLLVECLNSDCYVSRPVRQAIEDTLLLPYEKLKIENIA